MEDKTWVITYNSIADGNNLMGNYCVIHGSSPLEALQKKFGVPFKRVTLDNARYVEIMLVRGTFDAERNILTPYNSKYIRLCFVRC